MNASDKILIVTVEAVSSEQNDSYAVGKHLLHQWNQLVLGSSLPCTNHLLRLLQRYH